MNLKFKPVTVAGPGHQRPGLASAAASDSNTAVTQSDWQAAAAAAAASSLGRKPGPEQGPWLRPLTPRPQARAR